jgi:hypothetical protein
VSVPSITGGAYFLARVSIFLMGLGAAAWGACVFPSLQQQEPIERAASELLKGHEFSPRALTNLLARSEAAGSRTVCEPNELRGLVTLRIALLKSEIANHAPTDASYLQLRSLAQSALECSPSDAFVWTILFWLDASKHGITPNNAKFLQISYASGLNEGWIGFWRVQVAFPFLDRLPDALSQCVIGDFIKLLNTQAMYKELAEILASEPPGVQMRVVASLKATDPMVRQAFARSLHDKGIDIPGVEAPDRPWR